MSIASSTVHHPLMGHCNNLTATQQRASATAQIRAKEGLAWGGSVNTQTSCYVIARYAIWARAPLTTIHQTQCKHTSFIHSVYYTQKVGITTIRSVFTRVTIVRQNTTSVRIVHHRKDDAEQRFTAWSFSCSTLDLREMQN